MDNKQIKTASIIATAIITAILVLVLLVCRLYYSEIQGMEMPMVYLSLKISPYFGIITIVILSFAIFTTLISSLYPLKEYLEDFIPNKNVLFIITGVASFLLSRIGFTYIIKYIYPIQGIIGIAFIAFCAAYDINSNRLKSVAKFKKVKQKTTVNNTNINM